MSDLESLLEKVAVDDLAQIIRRVDGNHSLGAGQLAEAILAALSPPIKAGEAGHIANCCICGRVVDTRERTEGGDAFGVELEDGRWTCSIQCWNSAVGDAHPIKAGEAVPERVTEIIVEPFTDSVVLLLTGDGETLSAICDVACATELRDKLSAALTRSQP
jgi:hypothetical protein